MASRCRRGRRAPRRRCTPATCWRRWACCRTATYASRCTVRRPNRTWTGFCPSCRASSLSCVRRGGGGGGGAVTSALLDCRGQRCPAPVIALARRVVEVPVGAVVRVLADDPAAATDIPAGGRLRGHEYAGP